MLTTEIKNKIQLLWDRLWAGGLSNPIKAIEQISYLLFMKRLEKFHPEVKEEYKWSNYKDLKGSELKSRMVEVFNYIQNDLSGIDEPFSVEMRKAQFEIETPSLLEESITFIDDIYKKIEEEETKHQHFQDIQGDLYEYLLKSTSEAGKNGQFRTPRHIIQMMVELLEPKIENDDVKICDVTSGSSGFLVGAFQYILKENSSHREIDEDNQLEKGRDGDLLTKKKRNKLLENTFVGFDIDSTMVRIGMMNLMMHGIRKPNVKNLDSLSFAYEEYEKSEFEKISISSKPKKISAKKQNDLININEYTFGKDVYSYILANPPFSAKVNGKNVSKNLNRIYQIKQDGNTQQSLQTELLFLERIVFMLKNGGKAAVIVPEGVLFNSGKAHKKAREIVLKDCELMAVVSLPSGVFNPYTSVKTSILLFTKKEFNSNSYNTQRVWFYGMDSDGYSLDNSRKKIKNDFPIPITIQEFKDKESKNQDNRKQKHFYVPIEEIIKNGLELNYNLYKDYEYDEQDYQPPIKLLTQLIELENEISGVYNKLKQSFDEK